MAKAALLACGASLAAGLHVTTQGAAPATPDEILEAAIGRLEGMWPHKGREMLQDVFSSIPSHDHGVALQNKLLQRLRAGSAFVFAAFGSSVSAGHDNVMNQSWPFELERLVRPTFRDLGFDFEMRQRAAGGYGEMPFAAGCLLDRAGEDVDALSWEWHMFYDAPCEGYHFLGEAAAMESSPVVFGFADSGVEFAENLGDGRGAQACKDVRAQARRAVLRNHDLTLNTPRDWRPNEWYLTEEFASRKEAGRLSRESGACAEVRGVARGAPGMTWLQRTGVAPAFESRGHGFYPVAISAASKHVVGDPWYQAREKAFNINWHPGPLGHSMIASSVAHFILANLRSALVEEDGRHQGPSLDNPLVGTPIIGHLQEPQCGSLRAQGCRTGLLPTSAGTGLDGARDPHSADTWELAISMQSAQPATEAVDKRWVYRGNKTSGELRLGFTADSDGTYVLLCGAPCSWNCVGSAGYVASRSQRWWPKDSKGERADVSDLAFTVDGRAVDAPRLLELHDELFHAEAGVFCPGCKNPADLCQPVAKVGAGRHTVGARVEPRTPGLGRGGGDDVFVEILELMLVG